jgi:hypothetical protein
MMALTQGRMGTGGSCLFWFTLASAWLAACSTTANGGDASATSADTVQCAPETGLYPIDTYTADLTRAGANGVLTFELVESKPAPPVVGFNAFIVKVSRADGTPFVGELRAPNTEEGIFMPLHNHGPSLLAVVGPANPPSQGTYVVDHVDLFMSGYWQIRLNAYETTGSPDGGATRAGASTPSLPIDYGVFHFCT